MDFVVFTMKIAVILLSVAIFCLTVVTSTSSAGRAIQIVIPINHTFHLHLDELKPILENENIKDRHVVAVSIAGAFRQGKSFLSNFFLKYLHAQYQKHDATDWIGEKSNGNGLNGFKWRPGRKRETVGIWMWSEVFTHDFANGEKVAIILLDTQGIFDHQSSVRDCTTIFALSMMLSSVQCYNVMQKIKDLKNLELFTEYGRLALEQSDEKPFQKLIFVVRDWPFAFETGYGWNGQRVIEEALAGNENQTIEMRRLRDGIQMSFDEVSAFLMPHPGMIVAQTNKFTGDMKQVAPEFVNYTKELVPALFAPENLTLKKINGEKVRAQDFVQYLETFVSAFNAAADVIDANTIFMATVEASNKILFDDCLKVYEEFLQTAVKKVVYLSERDLEKFHQRAMIVAMETYLEKPRLGDAGSITSFRRKLKGGAEEKLRHFKVENEKKRQSFIKRAYSHIESISNEVLVAQVKDKIIAEIGESSTNSSLTYSNLNAVFAMARQAAMQEFDDRKIDDVEVTSGFRGKLERDFNELQLDLGITVEAYHFCLQQYNDRMQEALNAADYLSTTDLAKLHQNAKSEVISKFRSQRGDIGLKFSIQSEIERNIDVKFANFDQQNEEKRRHFAEKAKWHSETAMKEAMATFESSVWTSIGEQSMDDREYVSLFRNAKQNALEEFAAKRMNDDKVSRQVHQSGAGEFERELDELQSPLKRLSDLFHFYSDKMQESLNNVEYFSALNLAKLHHNVKSEAIAQFRSQPGDYEMKFRMQSQIEKRMDEKLGGFEKQNEKKSGHFKQRANWHSESARKEIASSFENKMRTLMSEGRLDANELIDEIAKLRQNALQEFAERKMGEDEISNQVYHLHREQLEHDLHDLQSKLKQSNPETKV